MRQQSFRQSQSTLHTWSGLLLGWVLFTVFVTGTIAFWREGMNRYMRPELAKIEQPVVVLQGAQRFLERTAPDAKTWFVAMPTERSAGANIFWTPQPKEGEQPRRRRGRRDTQALIGADGQPVAARDTRGGEFFYRFHFDLHYMPVLWARWLVGVASMMMLVAIITGIVTHKKIFRDFFTLRRGKGQRSWLDGHNATAVLALPFHLMITYTGLVTLMAMLMPWAVVANYTAEETLFDTLFPRTEAVRAGTPAPTLDLARMLPDARARLGGDIGYIDVQEAGDAGQRVTYTRSNTTMLNTRPPAVSYDAAGRVVWASPAPGAAAVTAGAMIGLHAGRYADDVLRWIYFLCGVAGSVMVASGLILWTVKRREKLPDPSRPHLGFRIVERLNVAVVGGFPLAVAAFLWGNRLLPVAMEGRAQWEVHVLFIAWAGALLVAFALRPARGWTILLTGTGAMLALLPVWNIVATDRGIPASLAAGDLLPAGVDLVLLVLAAGFLATARRVARHRPAAPRARRRVATPTAVPAETRPAVLEPAE